MLNQAFRMNRRRLGILRGSAILVAFIGVVHLSHRECARSADQNIPAELTKNSNPERNDRPQILKPEDFQATAYCVTGLTASGVPVAPGHVSADPKIIPLGSLIYVETPLMSGIYQVMDTGSLIKGRIIDIFIPSYDACIEFGRRIVKVKVLRYGFKDAPQNTEGSKSQS